MEHHQHHLGDLGRLERQVHNLTKLIDINGIINSTLDIGKLLTIIMEIIKEIMDTEASTLLLYDEESRDLVFKVALGEAGKELTEKYRVKIGQGIAGWVAENRKPVYVNDVYCDNRFDPAFDKHTGFTTKAILCTPLLFKGKLIGVIQAVNPVNRPGFDDDDMSLFQIFSHQAALAVQNAFYFQNALEEERIQGELTSARAIQSSLIPDINIAFGDINIAARAFSAREVGGEFHGLFHCDDNHLGISIGDIHEKGVPGALHASIVSGAIKALALTGGTHPARLVRKLSQAVSRDLESLYNVSMFYGVVNKLDRTLQFVNAGIAYPILIRDGVSRYLRFGEKSLGEIGDSTRRVLVKFRPGDFFVVLTDGILNVKSRGGKLLGLKRIMKFLEGDFSGPENVITSLVQYADEYSGGFAGREDISIMVFGIQ